MIQRIDLAALPLGSIVVVKATCLHYEVRGVLHSSDRGLRYDLRGYKPGFELTTHVEIEAMAFRGEIEVVA